MDKTYPQNPMPRFRWPFFLLTSSAYPRIRGPPCLAGERGLRGIFQGGAQQRAAGAEALEVRLSARPKPEETRVPADSTQKMNQH